MNHKTCFKCSTKKPTTEFYKHRAMGDGYMGKCKECTKRDVRENRNANIEEWREYDRERASLPHRVAQRKEIAERWKRDPQLKKRRKELSKSWQERNTIKRAAHIITGNAIRDGKLLRQSCEVCGDKRSEAHHDDYTRPLNVKWLCKLHHTARHVELREL